MGQSGTFTIPPRFESATRPRPESATHRVSPLGRGPQGKEGPKPQGPNVTKKAAEKFGSERNGGGGAKRPLARITPWRGHANV